MKNESEILIYRNPDGDVRLDVRLEDETVWLTQDHMAALFGKSKSTINEHIKNIFAEGELVEGDVMKKFGISEFQKSPVLLQLGRDYLGGIPGEVATGHTVPDLGHAAAQGVYREGVCSER